MPRGGLGARISGSRASRFLEIGELELGTGHWALGTFAGAHLKSHVVCYLLSGASLGLCVAVGS
jgi:hypothetical protein